MELARRHPVRALGALLLAAAICVVWLGLRSDEAAADAKAPALTVEVLNGTARSGLARQVTRLLREEGLDVVYFGTAGDRLDSTVVLVRKGDASRGHEVARLLGTKAVVVKPDPKRRVDVSVILGADYRLPKGRLPL